MSTKLLPCEKNFTSGILPNQGGQYIRDIKQFYAFILCLYYQAPGAILAELFFFEDAEGFAGEIWTILILGIENVGEFFRRKIINTYLLKPDPTFFIFIEIFISRHQPGAYKCDMPAQSVELVCERSRHFHPVHRFLDVIEPFHQRFALIRCQLWYKILLYHHQRTVPSEDARLEPPHVYGRYEPQSG